jgi:hypothetical protein
MSDINKIRNIFSDWPSEQDVAKSSENWAMLAQAFFFAAIVLNEESNYAQKLLHTYEGVEISEDLIMRLQTDIPSVFCLAFSLELAIKALLIHQRKLANIPANHSLLELANKIENFKVDNSTEKVLQWASNIVVHGKYPVSNKPSDDKNGVHPGISFQDLILNVEPVYKRFIELCSQAT